VISLNKADGSTFERARIDDTPGSIHNGTISGLFRGNFAIVASLTFKC
jgi:hypothetical protein